MATHGHRVSARFGLGELVQKAQGVRADVALFGHTHRPCKDMRDGVLCVNPGALCDGSYAILTLTEQQTDVLFRRCAF